MDYVVLANELTNDPLARGYATMSDSQAANSLNTPNRSSQHESVSGPAIFNAVVMDEFNAVTVNDQQRSYIGHMFTMDAVDIRPGTNARTALLAVFPSGTTTRTNLVNLVVSTVSRAQELGLGTVSHTDVAIARGHGS